MLKAGSKDKRAKRKVKTHDIKFSFKDFQIEENKLRQ